MHAQAPFDRTDFVPKHSGDNILPADPLFTRLLTLAHRPNPGPAIRDVNAGIERTAAQLLSDVLVLRRVLRSTLTPQTIDDLENGREVYVSILAPGGYEFVAGVLAVLALGAAASPFSNAQPVKEGCYYVNKAKSVALVTATSALKLGEAVAQEIRGSTNPDFAFVPINKSIESETPVALDNIKISSNRYYDPNAPGVVIFTSGTTGPPKGAVLKRAAMIEGGMAFAQQIGLREGDALLHLLPVHHATGIWVSFFPFIQTGACIEFKSGSFDPEWTWNRWRKGGLTHFTGVPTIYMRMMRYYLERATKLPPTEMQSYRDAAAAFKVCLCGTSALPKPISDFWADLLGRRIVQRYGSTELGVIFNMSADPEENIPDGSVGELTYGVDVKLSEGDEGEVLAKSCNMFSKYLHDPQVTANAHDADGYFKSGDVARREGKYYFIVGRASVDIIKSGGYKISALDIERELLALPYLGEAMVVGVPDLEFGQRVGAVVSLRDDQVANEFYQKNNRNPGKLTLDDLRDDVRSRLAGYKIPTLLRVIKGELPKSGTGKVVKKTLGPQYFPSNYTEDPEVQVWKNKSSARTAKL